jgi:hypothetical protein
MDFDPDCGGYVVDTEKPSSSSQNWNKTW